MDMNLRAFIESRVEKHPAKPFLYFQKEVLSYEAFNRKVNQAANGFLEWGVKRGDRVVLLLSNRPSSSTPGSAWPRSGRSWFP